MLTNNLLQKFSFLLPKKEHWPMYLVQIISFIFMISIFSINIFAESDMTGILNMAKKIFPVNDWYGLGLPIFYKIIINIHDSLSFIYKIQIFIYIFFLGKICKIVFNNKNIKLSIILFLLVFFSPFLLLIETDFIKDSMYLSLFTAIFYTLLKYIKNQKNIYYVIFFISSLLFVFIRINSYIIVIPFLFYASWIFVLNNKHALSSYKIILIKCISLIILHLLLFIFVLFILNKTYRDIKAYPSSTLIYNDILAIVTLEGTIRDKDIDYYAKKYIDKIGGYGMSVEQSYWSLNRIKDFDKLPIDKQEELYFLRYLLSNQDSGSFEKDSFKSRITSTEENRLYIKKVWLYAIIDNHTKYIQYKLFYIKDIFFKKHYFGNHFTKDMPIRSYITNTYNKIIFPLSWLILSSLVISLIYLNFIKRNDFLIIIIWLSIIFNCSVLVFLVPVPYIRYFYLEIFLMTLLTARNLISLIYYAFTKKKV